jgi:hypothetical protein
MAQFAFIDGSIVPQAEAALSILDRGFLFADGISLPIGRRLPVASERTSATAACLKGARSGHSSVSVQPSRNRKRVGRIMIRRYESRMAGYAFGSNPPCATIGKRHEHPNWMRDKSLI